jgi:CP family cyanate transporter-like MFS transporter
MAFSVPMLGGVLADWSGDARHAVMVMIGYALLVLPLAFKLNLRRQRTTD